MMCALGPLYLLRHHRVMPAMNLDHVTLRTADLEVTRGFLERVLDLKPGYRTAGRDQTGFAGDEDDPAPVAFQHAREAHH
jgi:catechol 2,3-dioxygenase-like lactoylglutathione lyase family enzyme